MRFGRLGGFRPGWDIVRFCYLVPRVLHMFVLHMFMLLATMEIGGSAHWLIAGFDKNQSSLYLSSSRTRMAPQVWFQFVAEVVECFSPHRQVIASSEELRTPRKPLGNREAVRKYREKKKAHAAFLEEEVKKLRATNQLLLRRLQRHAALEAEVARLRGLLFDVQGKIDAEIGAFPFQKHRSFGSVICTDPTLCFINDDAEVAAREESSGPTNFDFEIDESGSISRELDIPEVVNSMDAAASLVNSASLAE